MISERVEHEECFQTEFYDGQRVEFYSGELFEKLVFSRMTSEEKEKLFDFYCSFVECANRSFSNCGYIKFAELLSWVCDEGISEDMIPEKKRREIAEEIKKKFKIPDEDFVSEFN